MKGLQLRCTFDVLADTPHSVLLRDRAEPGRMSLTNDAERVLLHLYRSGYLTPGKSVFYYDSAGAPAEILPGPIPPPGEPLWDWPNEIGFAPFPSARSGP